MAKGRSLKVGGSWEGRERWRSAGEREERVRGKGQRRSWKRASWVGPLTREGKVDRVHLHLPCRRIDERHFTNVGIVCSTEHLRSPGKKEEESQFRSYGPNERVGRRRGREGTEKVSSL